MALPSTLSGRKETEGTDLDESYGGVIGMKPSLLAQPRFPQSMNNINEVVLTKSNEKRSR